LAAACTSMLCWKHGHQKPCRHSFHHRLVWQRSWCRVEHSKLNMLMGAAYDLLDISDPSLWDPAPVHHLHPASYKDWRLWSSWHRACRWDAEPEDNISCQAFEAHLQIAERK
jgi:hypothetical protein